MTEFDLLVAGGGLVGASLATALAGSGLRVAVVEAATPASDVQPSFDERHTALAPSSRRFFQALGLWPAIEPEAAPIRAIHVSERGRAAVTRMQAAEEGMDTLGHVVPNRVLGTVLRPSMAQAARVYAPARVVDVRSGSDAATVRVATEAGEQEVRTRLLAIADGSDSSLCAHLGIRQRVRDYGQTAVIANVRTERAGNGWAYERFTPDGPLAVLPAGEGRQSVVWTLPHGAATATAELSEPAFLVALQRAFGWRLGRMLEAGRRDCYALRAVRAERFVAGRAVVLGNAAHTLHPVAGQGFNLALRDVADLAERLAGAANSDRDELEGRVLADYEHARLGDYRRTFGFTDTLVRAFSNRVPGLVVARGAALAALELFPGLRRTLMTQAMGRAGTQPRLTRGLPLREAG